MRPLNSDVRTYVGLVITGDFVYVTVQDEMRN